MTLEKLNENFVNGNIDFNDYIGGYLLEGDSYTTYRDFNTMIDMGRAQLEGFEEITYVGNSGHLNFRYKFDKGALVPESVYIKTTEELKAIAKENLASIGIIVESNKSKVLRFNEFE